MDVPAHPTQATRVLCVLWPSFLMAGVLEMLVFAVVDPASLHWFGTQAVDWPDGMVYSVTFLIFWLGISTASALTQLLHTTPGQPDERTRHAI